MKNQDLYDKIEYMKHVGMSFQYLQKVPGGYWGAHFESNCDQVFRDATARGKTKKDLLEKLNVMLEGFLTEQREKATEAEAAMLRESLQRLHSEKLALEIKCAALEAASTTPAREPRKM